jgi:hypothetical protein
MTDVAIAAAAAERAGASLLCGAATGRPGGIVGLIDPILDKLQSSSTTSTWR